jgi:hypothetical protein
MRVTRIGAVGVAVAAMLASGAGFAAASTASSSASSVITGGEHLALMTTNTSADHYVVIANGLFTAGGQVLVTTPSTYLVKLPTGTFVVHHGSGFIIRKTLNPLTCLASLVTRGNIIINTGTGQFAGIHGIGTDTLVSLSILARNSMHQCDLTRNPVVLEQTVNANAKIRI